MFSAIVHSPGFALPEIRRGAHLSSDAPRAYVVAAAREKA
jgi:hypothetical protein